MVGPTGSRPNILLIGWFDQDGLPPIARFVQRHQIMLDHFGSGTICDQTCEWGIEWDTCASTSFKEESHLEASF
jgi:hypothetical protein